MKYRDKADERGYELHPVLDYLTLDSELATPYLSKTVPGGVAIYKDDASALALCGHLGPGYKPVHGVFTDSAEYTNRVAECTNISAGYLNQHGPKESQNLQYLSGLIDTLCDVPWESLPTVHKPGELDPFEMESWGWHGFSDPVDDLGSLVVKYPEVATDLLRRCGVSEDDFWLDF